MALVIPCVERPAPAVTISDMLPGRISRNRFFGIYEKDGYALSLSVTLLEIVKGCRTRTARDHLGHGSPESCLLDKLGKGPAQVTLLVPCVTTTLNIYPHPHHLLPPISPFDQSCPSLYLFSQGLRSSLSNRRRHVAPSRFSQTITDSGTSVSASMSVSECVVTIN